jgi:hypothetical protein
MSALPGREVELHGRRGDEHDFEAHHTGADEPIWSEGPGSVARAPRLTILRVQVVKKGSSEAERLRIGAGHASPWLFHRAPMGILGEPFASLGLSCPSQRFKNAISTARRSCFILPGAGESVSASARENRKAFRRPRHKSFLGCFTERAHPIKDFRGRGKKLRRRLDSWAAGCPGSSRTVPAWKSTCAH